MFKAYNQVRMHDTDMAGILYFASQFRFVHDAIEDFVSHLGFGLARLFTEEEFVFVIRHAEADYLAPLAVGDRLTIEVRVMAVGVSSFTTHYSIYRGGELVGTAVIVHVTLERVSRCKIPVPDVLRAALLSE